MSRNDGYPSEVIAALSAGNFVIGMGAFVVIGLLVPLSESFQVSRAEAGWMITAYALGYAVFSPLLVSVTGQIGRRRLLISALGIFAFATLLSALSPTVELLFLARIIAAAGAGLYTPAAAAVVAAICTADRRGRALAHVFFGLTLAQLLGVPMGSFIAYSMGWQASFILVAILALPCLLLIARIVPMGLTYQTTSLAQLRRSLLNLRQMLAVTFTVTFLGALYVVYTYFAAILADIHGFGRDGVTLILLIFGLGALLGNLMGGWLSDKIGALRTLAILCFCQILLMPLFSVSLLDGQPLPVLPLALTTFVWSLCGWSFMAGQQMRLLMHAPEAQAVILALNAAAIYLGAALGSTIGAAVISQLGLAYVGLSAGVIALAALIHLLIGERMQAGVDLPSTIYK